MRAIFLILIIAVVALIAAISVGLIDVRQTRPAVAPTVESADGRVTTQPGQAPAFDVETGSIGVGTRDAQVTVPSLEVRPPAGENSANTANTANTAAPAR